MQLHATVSISKNFEIRVKFSCNTMQTLPGLFCLLVNNYPTNPDIDKDLLDGFEYSNGMSTKRADDRNADANADVLTNLQEQFEKLIH